MDNEPVLNFIERVITAFAGKAPEAKAPKSKYADYTVEFYPENEVYYAKYKAGYLRTNYGTGIVEASSTWSGFVYADRFKEERCAWKLIDKHIEQQTKENVKIIRRTE